MHNVGTRISKTAAPAVIMKFGLSSLCANIQRLRRFQERPSSHSACEAVWAWRTLPHNIQGCWHVKGRSNVQRASIISLFRAPSARSCIASSGDIFKLEPPPPFHRHFSAKGQTPQYARSRSYSQALKYSSLFACKE